MTDYTGLKEDAENEDNNCNPANPCYEECCEAAMCNFHKAADRPTILALIAELEESERLREAGTIGPGHGVGWTGVAAEWAALPRRIREWVAELETRCDPAGDLRQRRIAEDRAVGFERDLATEQELRRDRESDLEHEFGLREKAEHDLAYANEGLDVMDSCVVELRNRHATANKLIEAQHETLEVMLALEALAAHDDWKKGRDE